MKKLSVIILSLMFAFLFAQDMKNIENYRIYKMSEYLELTPEQAETFFPLLRQYEKEIKNIKVQENELYDELKAKQSAKEEISQEELQTMMGKVAGFENTRSDLKQNFMKQSGKMLKPGQVASIPSFEKDFRDHLKKQFIQRQKQNKPPKKKLFKGKR
jgi:uncharacterized protein YihD (DUF1040 family)